MFLAMNGAILRAIWSSNVFSNPRVRVYIISRTSRTVQLPAPELQQGNNVYVPIVTSLQVEVSTSFGGDRLNSELHEPAAAPVD